MPAPETVESAVAVAPRSFLATLRDVAALAKPRLSSLVLFTTAGGLFLAPGEIPWWRALVTLLGTIGVVASANTLNCYLERDTDALMKRTRTRPLPAGRLEPAVALGVGIALSAVCIPALTWLVNPLSGALAALAVVSYVAVYTPMKRTSPLAVYVGALPGAIPPLMGWTAVTNRLDLGGLVLFAALFIWQIPHSLAIALYLREDYRRAGMRVWPVVYGEEATRWHIVYSSLVLVPVTFALEGVGIAGKGYLLASMVLGAGFFAWAATGIVGKPRNGWARGLMLASVAYLSLLFVALGLDAV